MKFLRLRHIGFVFSRSKDFRNALTRWQNMGFKLAEPTHTTFESWGDNDLHITKLVNDSSNIIIELINVERGHWDDHVCYEVDDVPITLPYYKNKGILEVGFYWEGDRFIEVVKLKTKGEKADEEKTNPYNS